MKLFNKPKYYYVSYVTLTGYNNCSIQINRGEFYFGEIIGSLSKENNGSDIAILSIIKINKKQFLEHEKYHKGTTI
jgi:hypothetical protein